MANNFINLKVVSWSFDIGKDSNKLGVHTSLKI